MIELLCPELKNGHIYFDDTFAKSSWEPIPESWTKCTQNIAANENPVHGLDL